jgi:hypothetical protein
MQVAAFPIPPRAPGSSSIRPLEHDGTQLAGPAWAAWVMCSRCALPDASMLFPLCQENFSHHFASNCAIMLRKCSRRSTAYSRGHIVREIGEALCNI